MNTLPKPILAIIISFSFQNRAVCRRWRDTVKYTFDKDDFDQICARGTVSVMKMFLAQYPDQHWFNGFRLISASGDLDLLKFVRNKYSCREYDYFILTKACSNKHLHIVKYLIANGAETCSSVIRHAYMGGCDEIIKIVCENKNNYSCETWSVKALAGAAAGGHEKIFMSLLETHIDFAHKEEIFEAACKGGNLKIVSMLHELNKNSSHINKGLYFACKKKRTEVVRFLIQNGVNNWNGGLQGACEGRCPELILLMIQHGANDLNRGLIAACERNFVDIFSLMIQYGADEWEDGLYYACMCDSVDVVREILHHKSLDTTDGLEVARCNECKKILRFFGK